MNYFNNRSAGITEMLSDNLWDRNGLMQRSAELSPLYILRYAGPRTARIYTEHSYHELVFVVRGTGELCSSKDGDIALKAGTAVLVPPEMEHYEISDQPMDTIWIGVTGSRLSSLPHKLICNPRCNELSKLFDQIYFESKIHKKNSGMLLDSLLSLIFARIFAKDFSETNPGIEQAIKYIHENFHKSLNISLLAHNLGYSDGYFYRLFKKNYHMTPGEFLNKIRIEHAIEMIRRTSLSFTQIANLCGIKDSLYFSRVIKNATGDSPRVLRMKMTIGSVETY